VEEAAVGASHLSLLSPKLAWPVNINSGVSSAACAATAGIGVGAVRCGRHGDYLLDSRDLVAESLLRSLPEEKTAVHHVDQLMLTRERGFAFIVGARMVDFDPGPPQQLAALFERCPAPKEPSSFWTDWGPIFYRGRLDGSARVLCIGSDPGPTERIANRAFVGDAGQRVQGFLAKLGLTRSYLCLNAFPYAFRPSRAARAEALLREANLLSWRNELYDAVRSARLQAIVAFGVNARIALQLWPGRPSVPSPTIPHPSSHDPTRLLREWRQAVTDLREAVSADSDGDQTLSNYGSRFREADYAPVPRRDLPFGVPDFLGDDSAGRRARPRRQSSVSRPVPDDLHTLIWKAPRRR
jgi:uracil-DNA glycosylase